MFHGGRSGYIEKLTITINDANPLIRLFVNGIDEKRGTKSLPLNDNFLLDMVVAKNNAIAPNEETYRRTLEGLSVTIVNVYAR